MAVIAAAPPAVPALDLFLAATITAPVAWGQSPNATPGASGNVDRWISELGVDFETASCEALRYGPIGCSSEYDLSNPGAIWRMGHVCPIEVFAPYGGCSIRDITIARLLALRAEFARRVGSVLARAFWLGDAWSDQSACQWLTKVDGGQGFPFGAYRGLDSATDVYEASLAEALAVSVGAASLVDPGNQGMILCSPYMAERLAANGNVYRGADQKLRTLVGSHIIVADPGFPTNIGPGGAPETAAEWIMVTPAVQSIVAPVEVVGIENLSSITTTEGLRAAMAATESVLVDRSTDAAILTLHTQAAALFAGCGARAIRVALPQVLTPGLSSGLFGASAGNGGAFGRSVVSGTGGANIGPLGGTATGSGTASGTGGVLVGETGTAAGVATTSAQGAVGGGGHAQTITGQAGTSGVGGAGNGGTGTAAGSSSASGTGGNDGNP